MSEPAGLASAFLAALEQEAVAWALQGLQRQRREVAGPCGPRLSFAGESGEARVSFLSNDYLGLAAHPRLREAIAEGALRWGAGAGASALVSGHMVPHARAEEALAAFLGFPRALLFITGYMANLAILTALLQGEQDAVFSDQLNHASLIDGCRLCRARIVRFPHGDLAALERALIAHPARRRLIVTDAVFSMDGDCADLTALLALAERFDALLLVDDAHGFGVLGPDGRGSVAEAGLVSDRLIVMATLGKAAGLSGACVASTPRVVDHLIQHARTYVFSTAPAPSLAAAVPVALDLIAGAEAGRAQLAQLRARLCGAMAGHGIVVPPGRTAIVPWILGSADRAVSVATQVAGTGLLVAAIRPPTVPVGTARVRLSLTAAHQLDDVDRLAVALGQAAV